MAIRSCVALRKESVDRNHGNLNFGVNDGAVALRKESVDRNRLFLPSVFRSRVALRKESVDRNLTGRHFVDLGQKSLSARRAWIEIRISPLPRSAIVSLSARRAWIEIDPVTDKAWALEVALRKESVDRNWQDIDDRETISASLSARRAWIEIRQKAVLARDGRASLSARRAWIEMQVFQRIAKPFRGRSPQGERG